MIQEKRAQGRPARGSNEVGSQKIIEGMQVALRALQITNITRRDLARYAGVTPALVTYYFPERNTLIEAATLPVVEALVSKVVTCLNDIGPTRPRLLRAAEVMLEYYARDAVIIQLFGEHRALEPDAKLPDLLRDLETSLKSFFERWLMMTTDSVYSAEFLQRAAIGMCKSIAQLQNGMFGKETTEDAIRNDHAKMICDMLLQPCPR